MKFHAVPINRVAKCTHILELPFFLATAEVTHESKLAVHVLSQYLQGNQEYQS